MPLTFNKIFAAASKSIIILVKLKEMRPKVCWTGFPEFMVVTISPVVAVGTGASSAKRVGTGCTTNAVTRLG